MGIVLRSAGYRALLTGLKDARTRSGLTQADLAAKIGRPQSFIAKIENGERRVDVVEMVVLARLLRVDPAILLARVEKATPRSQKL